MFHFTVDFGSLLSPAEHGDKRDQHELWANSRKFYMFNQKSTLVLPGDSMSAIAFTDLSMEFGKIICIITLGFISRRNQYISFKKQTLAQLLSKLILPTVFFYSTATMDILNMNIMIAFYGLLSRFAMVLIYYILIHFIYIQSSELLKLQYWAMSTLFVTMSYDIPIGFPIAKLLWTNNNESQYILHWAALSKIFIMSLCIAILN